MASNTTVSRHSASVDAAGCQESMAFDAFAVVGALAVANRNQMIDLIALNAVQWPRFAVPQSTWAKLDWKLAFPFLVAGNSSFYATFVDDSRRRIRRQILGAGE